MLKDASWGRFERVPSSRQLRTENREPRTSQFYRGVHGGRPSDVPDVPIKDGDVVVDSSDEVDVFVTDRLAVEVGDATLSDPLVPVSEDPEVPVDVPAPGMPVVVPIPSIPGDPVNA
jgi:hypothetical protein